MIANRLRWWGLLIEAPLEEARAVVEPVLGGDYRSDDYTLVAGDGWTGVWVFVEEEAPRTLASKIRAATREVVILEWGECEDAMCVTRWRDGKWRLTAEHPDDVERAHGIEWIGAEDLDTRPFRWAALVIGPSLDELAANARDQRHVLATPRGVVVLDEVGLVLPYTEGARVTLYQVTHYLDDDSFDVSLTTPDDQVSVFYWPQRDNVFGLPSLAEVDGETEPRAIVRKLGIPEDYMFPSR
jgi:hypothetical protein